MARVRAMGYRASVRVRVRARVRIRTRFRFRVRVRVRVRGVCPPASRQRHASQLPP